MTACVIAIAGPSGSGKSLFARTLYDEFISPSASHADMVITRGGRNRVALDFVRGHLLGRDACRQR